jgi:molybdopterin biosynthesis enzyme
MGHRRLFRRTLPVRLNQAIKSKPGRVEFVRATLSRNAEGQDTATPTASQSSGDILSMAHADALLVAPCECGKLSADEIVQAQLLEAGMWQA